MLVRVRTRGSRPFIRAGIQFRREWMEREVDEETGQRLLDEHRLEVKVVEERDPDAPEAPAVPPPPKPVEDRALNPGVPKRRSDGSVVGSRAKNETHEPAPEPSPESDPEDDAADGVHRVEPAPEPSRKTGPGRGRGKPKK